MIKKWDKPISMDLKKILRSRRQILNGVTNTVFKKKFVEDVAKYRMDICKDCEYYNGKCEVPGTGPCCGACGCVLKFKVRSLSSHCGLLELNKEPKWKAHMTQEQEDEHLTDIQEDD